MKFIATTFFQVVTLSVFFLSAHGQPRLAKSGKLYQSKKFNYSIMVASYYKTATEYMGDQIRASSFFGEDSIIKSNPYAPKARLDTTSSISINIDRLQPYYLAGITLTDLYKFDNVTLGKVINGYSLTNVKQKRITKLNGFPALLVVHEETSQIEKDYIRKDVYYNYLLLKDKKIFKITFWFRIDHGHVMPAGAYRCFKSFRFCPNCFTSRK